MKDNHIIFQITGIQQAINILITVHCILTLTIVFNPLMQEVEEIAKVPQRMFIIFFKHKPIIEQMKIWFTNNFALSKFEFQNGDVYGQSRVSSVQHNEIFLTDLTPNDVMVIFKIDFLVIDTTNL